ncbi:GL21607 [Drosophila persimilis]|uniref:GL21607 n=1 Tax=Drosophila persimilis TaxID=7234 RepID=B4GFL7_DROPE|nr:GL21607 [Drosophila persimilis]
MFSSHRHLKRRTPDQGIDRREYIGHLVDEYYTTTNVEALEQVTANLANFAYDPINWPHLHEAEAFDVFIASLKVQNQNLQLHGIAAICNICLDKAAAELIREHLSIISGLFVRTDHPEIVLHSLALFYQLLNAGQVDKELLLTPPLLKGVQEWRQKSHDQRIVKLCQLLLEDFARRTEIIELQNVPPILPPPEQPCTSSSQSAAGPKERRVHGALLNAVVAGIMGTKLPGPGTVVLEQSFKFLKPCRIETDTVVTVRLLQSRKISTAEYDCRQNDEIVFAGNAKLLTRNHID